MDKVRAEEGGSAPENPSSPVESSSSGSAVSEVVLWTHSDSSDDSSDDCMESAKSMLDFRSPTFSPVLALKCGESEVMQVSEGAKQYLNLVQYSKAVQSPSKSPRKDVAHVKKLKMEQLEKRKKEPEPTPSSSSSSAANPPNFPIPGRRFLPHQLPVYRPRKEHPNTITLMNCMDGPISVLRRVMTEKTRIKIWIRNDKGFRGFLTGFVEAFDKHWNIALRDVDEQFVRKKDIKFPTMGDNISEDIAKGITGGNQDESCVTASKRTSGTEKGNNNNDDNEDKKKEQAISSAFIRLKNYLRQNDGMTRKGMGMRSASTVCSVSTQTNKNKSSRKNRSSSKDPIISPTTTTTKSKTVYVGDMDPLSICRTGLANLSLRDDIHHHQPQQQNLPAKKVDSLRASPRSKRKSTTIMPRPDIVQCHQTRRRGTTATTTRAAECSSSSQSAATSSSASTCSTQQHQQHPPPPNIISKTSLKKKSLTVFKTPYEDSFGFMVVAQTRKYELVERHVGQVLLMGNDIVFIETSGGGC